MTDKFRIVSRVSDKKPNDAGHPIQYDTSAGQWFVHTLPQVIPFIMVLQYTLMQLMMILHMFLERMMIEV